MVISTRALRFHCRGQKRDYVSIDHNQLLRDAHAACLPHYQAIHAHRLAR